MYHDHQQSLIGLVGFLFHYAVGRRPDQEYYGPVPCPTQRDGTLPYRPVLVLSAVRRRTHRYRVFVQGESAAGLPPAQRYDNRSDQSLRPASDVEWLASPDSRPGDRSSPPDNTLCHTVPHRN